MHFHNIPNLYLVILCFIALDVYCTALYFDYTVLQGSLELQSAVGLMVQIAAVSCRDYLCVTFPTYHTIAIVITI